MQEMMVSGLRTLLQIPGRIGRRENLSGRLLQHKGRDASRFLAVVLLSGCVIVPVGCGEQTRPESPASPPSPSVEQAEAPSAGVANRLVNMGWTRSAAEAVADAGNPWFDQLAQRRVLFDRQLALLGPLGRDKAMLEFVSRSPEAAGLLAGVVDEDPAVAATVLKVLVRYHSEPVVSSLFAVASAPRDACQIASALDRDGDIIIPLLQAGDWSAVPWFCDLNQQLSVQRVWRAWLRDLYQPVIGTGDDEALDRVQVLLTIHAAAVQQLLAESESFRAEFLDRHWPAFARILERQSDDIAWGIFVSEPRIWEFFDQFGSDGVRLFGSHGPLAVDLLCDPSYADVQARVVAALNHSDEQVLAALFDPRLRSQPLFVKLLGRDLPGGSLAAALSRLGSAGDRVPKKLEYFATLDDETLIEALGPPPSGPQTWLPGYSMYYLMRRVATGQQVTMLDAALSVAETALDVVPAFKGGTAGLKLVQRSVTSGLKKRGVTMIAKESQQASLRSLLPWVLREGFSSVRTRLTTIGRAAEVDLTSVVRMSFGASGFGRASFRRFSGLEARVFMRADRRVVVNLAEVAQEHHVIGRLARETVNGAAVQLAAAGVGSVVPVDETAMRGAKVAVEGVAQASELAAKPDSPVVDKAWKRHLAVWWLACTLGESHS